VSKVEGSVDGLPLLSYRFAFYPVAYAGLRAIFSKGKACMARRIDTPVMYASSSADTE
jgi:hypothetical protein